VAGSDASGLAMIPAVELFFFDGVQVATTDCK
jgi:hypothetical protein